MPITNFLIMESLMKTIYIEHKNTHDVLWPVSIEDVCS